MKLCTKCKETKPLFSFSKCSGAKDGLQYHCKTCILDYQHRNPKRKSVLDKYRNANKELCNQRSIVSQNKNRSYYTQKTLEWQEKNKDRYLQNRKNWYAKNSSKDIERVRRRAGRIRQGLVLMTEAEVVEVQGMYDFCRIFKSFEVDHIIPLNGKFVSGLHVLKNLQVLHRSHNRSKGASFNSNVFANKD